MEMCRQIRPLLARASEIDNHRHRLLSAFGRRKEKVRQLVAKQSFLLVGIQHPFGDRVAAKPSRGKTKLIKAFSEFRRHFIGFEPPGIAIAQPDGLLSQLTLFFTLQRRLCLRDGKQKPGKSLGRRGLHQPECRAIILLYPALAEIIQCR